MTVMDRVSSYPPEFVESFFKTERCLITRACQPPKVYRPCTDVLPRTMAWLAAGVPTDFIDRVDARMARVETDTERVLTLDGNNPDVTIVPASEMRFPEWDVLCEPPIGDEREAFFWRALIRTYGEDEAIERANLGEHGMAQVPDPGE
jgi:hypothetical protein